MKTFWISAGVVLLLLAGVAYWFYSTKVTPSDPQNPITLPSGDSVSPGTGNGQIESETILVAGQQGTFFTTKDFVNNGETVADTQNPGSHVLAGGVGYCLGDGTCPEGYATKNFGLTYNETTHFFNIILLSEPLGAVRKEAEQFLESRLGLTRADMCGLNYFVGTPYWINEAYDDRNLGFSFCEGATALP